MFFSPGKKPTLRKKWIRILTQFKGAHLANDDVSDIQKDEWVGIGPRGVVKPKSLSILSGDQLAYALKGICLVWDRVSENEGIKLCGNISLKGHSAKEFEEFLLYYWIQNFNRILTTNLVPIFSEFRESLPICVGQVDYVHFELNSDIGFPEFKTRYTNLSFDRPELAVIRDGYEALRARLSEFRFLKDDIGSAVVCGLQILREVPRSKNPFSNALSVYNQSAANAGTSKYLTPKLVPLKEVIEFFSQYLVFGTSGFKNDQDRLTGVLFNLNYLLEHILRFSLSSLYSKKAVEHELFGNQRINSIPVFSNGKKITTRSMNPDCVGVFSGLDSRVSDELKAYFENRIYIVDAKHKQFIDKGKIVPVNRNDFLQIVAYARTHNSRPNLKSFYALVGLDEETTVQEQISGSAIYIRSGSDNLTAQIKVRYDEEELTIHQIPLRFAQIVYDLGRAENGKINEVFSEIGLQLMRSIVAA